MGRWTSGLFEFVLASSVYVSPAYAGDAPGTMVTWTDGSTHLVGSDAFGTIQAGVNAVAAGGTVNIAAGTYTEQITTGWSLTLAAQAARPPRSRPRPSPAAPRSRSAAGAP